MEQRVARSLAAIARASKPQRFASPKTLEPLQSLEDEGSVACKSSETEE